MELAQAIQGDNAGNLTRHFGEALNSGLTELGEEAIDGLAEAFWKMRAPRDFVLPVAGDGQAAKADYAAGTHRFRSTPSSQQRRHLHHLFVNAF